ncbi:MAG: hypothetical protein NTX79_01250 [Candidatus Micrarchaeota archaeon]|nr:hypothetical protein [Candidatus Micrarchaeota archaeon]
MATVTKLAQYDNSKGLTQKEAISTANRMNSRILSNKEFDGRLVLSDTWKSEKEVYPAWTGTLVAFKGKNEKLGDVVKYTDSKTNTTYLFEVPKEYQKERNAILVVNHGFLASGDALIVPNEKGSIVTYDISDKSQVALLLNFPSSDGWYSADNKFGIPLGNGISSSNTDARYLYKVQNYVGLLARGDYFGNSYRRGVDAGVRPSNRFGVLISTEDAKMGAATLKPEAAKGEITIVANGDFKAALAEAKQEVANAAAVLKDGVLAKTQEFFAKIEAQLKE